MDKIFSKLLNKTHINEDIKEKPKCIYEICTDPNETRSVFYMDGIKYKIPNPALDEYSKKYKPDELTADGIATTKTQLREIDEADKMNEIKDHQKNYNREMIQRVKCLCLYKMDKSIMYNTCDLTDKERNKLQSLMWKYNDTDHEIIRNKFNELVDIEIFLNKRIDISKLPIYNVN